MWNRRAYGQWSGTHVCRLTREVEEHMMENPHDVQCSEIRQTCFESGPPLCVKGHLGLFRHADPDYKCNSDVVDLELVRGSRPGGRLAPLPRPELGPSVFAVGFALQ